MDLDAAHAAFERRIKALEEEVFVNRDRTEPDHPRGDSGETKDDGGDRDAAIIAERGERERLAEEAELRRQARVRASEEEDGERKGDGADEDTAEKLDE